MRFRSCLVGLAIVAMASASAAGSRSSESSRYVAPHVTKNGTYVQGHYRSHPNGTASDNWSARGNVNPYTGESGKAAPSPAGLYEPSTWSKPASSYGSSTSGVPRTYAAPPSVDRTSDVPKSRSSTLGAPYRPPTAKLSQRERSSAMRSAFQRQHPCPSTGRTSGACPGYVVDHVSPLKRGGPDRPSNMQWQTIDAAKAKDRVE